MKNSKINFAFGSLNFDLGSYWHEEFSVKRRFNRLQCLGKGNSVLLHRFNQGLGDTRRQTQHLFQCLSLNQETRESRASGKITAFFKELDFEW